MYKLLLRWIWAVQPAETLPFHSRGGLYNGVLEYVGVKIALPHILREHHRIKSVVPHGIGELALRHTYDEDGVWDIFFTERASTRALCR